MRIDLDPFGVPEATGALEGIEGRAGNLLRPLGDIADDFFQLTDKAFGGSPSLIRTGALQDSLTGKGEGAVRDIGLDEAVFGTSVWYAVFHGRKLLEGVDYVALRRWEALLNDYIVTGSMGMVGL